MAENFYLGITVLILSIFGIVVNVASIVILMLRQGASQMFHHLLKLLALYDLVSIYLAKNIQTMGLRQISFVIHHSYEQGNLIWRKYFWTSYHQRPVQQKNARRNETHTESTERNLALPPRAPENWESPLKKKLNLWYQEIILPRTFYVSIFRWSLSDAQCCTLYPIWK